MKKKQMIRKKMSLFLALASMVIMVFSVTNGWENHKISVWADTASEEYILPDSDTDYVSEDELSDFDDEELRYARNEIYARHGYIFKDEELNKYFQEKSWYNPSVTSEDFDESEELNNVEKANIKFIKAYETGNISYRTAQSYDESEEQEVTTEATTAATEATTSEEEKIEQLADEADKISMSDSNKKKEEIPEFAKYVMGLFVIILTVIQFYAFMNQNIVIGGIGGSIIACGILSFIEVGVVWLVLKSILGAILSVFKVLFIIVVVVAIIGGVVIGISVLKNKAKDKKE